MDSYVELQLDQLDSSIERLNREHYPSMDRKSVQTVVDRLRKTRRALDSLLGEVEDSEREHLMSAFESMRDIEMLRDQLQGIVDKFKDKNERPD